MSYRRCPLGDVDKELRIRRVGGNVELREFHRSVSDVGSQDFHPTDRVVHIGLPWVEHLADLLGIVAAEAVTAPTE